MKLTKGRIYVTKGGGVIEVESLDSNKCYCRIIKPTPSNCSAYINCVGELVYYTHDGIYMRFARDNFFELDILFHPLEKKLSLI
jgi:hypothetical protein